MPRQMALMHVVLWYREFDCQVDYKKELEMQKFGSQSPKFFRRKFLKE